MPTGAFILFIIGVVIAVAGALWVWLTQLGGLTWIKDRFNISPDIIVNANAQLWHYFSANVKNAIYVGDIKYYFWRWKFIKRSEFPGKTRYGISYKPWQGDIPKPYYLEVNDDKFTQIAKENLDSMDGQIWRVLTDTQKDPLHRELESTRKQRDIAKVQARTANYNLNKLTLDEAARKAFAKMQEGKVASSRNMRNIGNRYDKEGNVLPGGEEGQGEGDKQ